MGGQQLLLIVLGFLLVGVAIAIGISLFNDNSISHSRDAITNEMVRLAARAQQYYRTPKSMQGGGNSFNGLNDIRELTTGGNGIVATYSLANDGNSITLTGIGKDVGRDGVNPVRVVVVVLKDSLFIDVSKEN
jgi:hypothetical protein